jgi:hypothetical protein
VSAITGKSRRRLASTSEGSTHVEEFGFVEGLAINEIHVLGVVVPPGSEIQLGASGGNPEGFAARASRVSFSTCLSIARCTGVSPGLVPSGEGANFEMNSEWIISLP